MAPKKAKQKAADPTWDHCTRVSEGNRLNLRCNYCKVAYWGGINRMKHHLAGDHDNASACTACPDNVRKICIDALEKFGTQKSLSIGGVDSQVFEEQTNESVGEKGKVKDAMDAYVAKGKGGQKQLSMNAMLKNRDNVVQSICRFLYGNSLSFNLVKSPLFVDMLSKVGEYGRGLKPPSYHEARVTCLKKEVDNVNLMLEKYRKEWKKTGCTLMSDGWTDKKSRSLINFLVNSPSGTVFIKSIYTSNVVKDAQKLFELLDSMVDEIGEENVVQVVTDSASAYVAAGELLMEKRKKLFWSPCAAHCIDNILEDIGEFAVFKDTIKKAKEASVYIYRHAWVLSLFRAFSDDTELKRAGVTRFATAFLTLSSFSDNKIALRAMFASEEWAKSQYASKAEGKKVAEIILSDDRFWKAITYCMKCVGPLVTVLRLVDGDAIPAMGYIYEAMDRAKELIATNFNRDKARYQRIWDVIDRRWNLQLHRPLHAAGYFLNPKFQYDDNFEADMEVKVGLYETIQRMCPQTETKIKIDQQLEKFKKSEGIFGIPMATLTRDKKQPALWWESYGDECIELQKLAIRVLSLTCSATGCETNWSAFEHIHSKKRNRLEQKRLSALVFVKYNIQLELRQKKRQEEGKTYDPICLSDMESDNEWITEVEEPCLPLDNSWMDMHECFEDNEVGTSNKRKRGPRNLVYGRKDKRHEHTLPDDEIEDLTLVDNARNEGEKELESVDMEGEDQNDDDFLDDEE